MQSSIVCGISNLLFTEAFLLWKTSQEWILCTYSVESKLNIRKMFIWFPRCLMFASTNMLAARKLPYWFFMYFCWEYFTFYPNLLSNRYFLISKLKHWFISSWQRRWKNKWIFGCHGLVGQVAAISGRLYITLWEV